MNGGHSHLARKQVKLWQFVQGVAFIPGKPHVGACILQKYIADSCRNGRVMGWGQFGKTGRLFIRREFEARTGLDCLRGQPPSWRWEHDLAARALAAPFLWAASHEKDFNLVVVPGLAARVLLQHESRVPLVVYQDELPPLFG